MAEVKKTDGRKPYVLTRKSHQGIDENGKRREYSPGDTVLLTTAQYEAFRDRFVTPAVFKARQAAAQVAIEEAAEEEVSAPAPASPPAPTDKK